MNLLLHIGTEKTGTTFLQEWLYDNRAYLSDQGFFLSDQLERPNNRKLVSYVQTGVDDYLFRLGIRSLEEKSRFFQGFEQEFRDEVKRARTTHHHMIISSEHFHSRLGSEQELQTLYRLLADLFDEIHVLCYVREQADLHASLYSTALRLSCAAGIADFKHVRAEDPYYNYHRLATLWAGTFGKASVHFRIYDPREFVAADIRRDFCRALAPVLDISRLCFSNPACNQRLSLLQAEAFRAVNQQFPYWERGIINDRIHNLNQFYKQILEHCPGLRWGSVEHPGRAELQRLFAESNRLFFAEYIGAGKSFGAAARSPSREAEQALTADALAHRVGDLLRCLFAGMGERLITDQDADFLSALAVKCETQAPLSREEASALREMAARARLANRATQGATNAPG